MSKSHVPARLPPLFKLPRELRDMVYRQVLCPDTTEPSPRRQGISVKELQVLACDSAVVEDFNKDAAIGRTT